LAKKAEKVQKFQIGYKQRQQNVINFRKVVKQTKSDIQGQEEKLKLLEEKLIQHQNIMTAAKQKYIYQRIGGIQQHKKYSTSTSQLIEHMIQTFNLEELQWFIAYTCQLSGEIESASSNSGNMNNNDIKTCVPLRLAGLDYGMTWDAGTYQWKQFSINDSRNTNDDESRQSVITDLADILIYNSEPANTRVWTTSMIRSNDKSGSSHHPKKRRRLSEEMNDDEDDEEYEEEVEDEFEDHHDDDDDYDDVARYHPDHDQHYDSRSSASSPSLSDEVSETTNKDELLQKIKGMPLSTSRLLFTEQSKSLLDQIQQLEQKMNENNNNNSPDTSASDDDTEDDKVEDSASTNGEDGSATPAFDPMSVTMIRNTIESRSKLIERGYNYAVSALVLMDAVLDTLSDDNLKVTTLQDLVVGTIYHSNLSSVHMYEILQHVVPELKVTTPLDDDDKTCTLPWAKLCPPKTTQRKIEKSSIIIIPPEPIVDAVQRFCDQKQTETPPSGGPGFCSADETIFHPESIPSDIPDGSFGYSIVQRRSDDDILNSLFDASMFQTDTDARNEINDLSKTLESIKNEQETIKSKIQELEKSIGGDDITKLGLDGELHSIRDSCFDIEAGKYVYEVCMFQGAKQRDIGTKQGGTNLGQWHGTRIDEATGTRIWKWTDGEKCWNGPKRSATVHVTCGKEHKVLTAEEPDTCRYVFEMESPIACDDEYRKLHEL
jgi:Glucosidase II beta subunit-like protein